MKRLLLVLFMLGVTIPASADVLVYNAKENVSGVTVDPWEALKIKWTESAYIVIDFNSSNETAHVWAVYIGKDKEDGPWADLVDMGGWDFIRAQVGKKWMWIISGADEEHRALLTGEEKLTKIGPVSAALAGFSIWDEVDGSEREMCISKMSLKLNAAFTVKFSAATGEDTVNDLLEYLEDEGYDI